MVWVMPHILLSLVFYMMYNRTAEDSSPGTETSNTFVLDVGEAQMCHK